ncbi:MAG TPA: 30S ribosomal protein S4 [Ruminococcaceae bacterium]|nr:30S ribosomal protein S4 [Oscillospiraceae bacterium]HBJ11623.1 30S ribosomal protein S4 [Oscillospiraceae bacterium]HCD81112.1 30S ribosomal protein S4 [Oscillospiraceae bacterium]
MARYTGAVCRLCRREGQKLFLKGERCYSEKCSVGLRGYAPGQHGQGRKKSSEYGMQLRAKQTARRFYGVQENQFHHYFEIAERKQGITGDNLLRILESRLDNVVYRVGFASSRAEARQLVGHGHYEVNGKRVDIASYLLKAGDVVSVCEKSRGSEKMKAVIEANGARPVPEWIDVDREKLTAKVIALPTREQIEAPVDEQLIVEFYSK